MKPAGPGHYLVFTLNSSLFAIDVMAVREIGALPELTIMDGTSLYISGAFNLRGRIVPVTDLNIRLGRPFVRYRLSDMVIVLEVNGRVMGIIVNNVNEVRAIPLSDIGSPPLKAGVDIIAGDTMIDGDIVSIINHDAIVELPLSPVIPTEKPGGTYGFEACSPEEKGVFKKRAEAMMQPPEEPPAAQLSLAVVGLNNEYYGVDLETVREFSVARNITPVPCCPGYIAGNMNLRGDILTLIDIREMLNIPLKGVPAGQKVVVTRINDLLAGVMVDEVFDVAYMNQSDLRPVPLSVKASGNDYISGEAPYAGRMLSILDLKRILTREELIVDEES